MTHLHCSLVSSRSSFFCFMAECKLFFNMLYISIDITIHKFNNNLAHRYSPLVLECPISSIFQCSYCSNTPTSSQELAEQLNEVCQSRENNNMCLEGGAPGPGLGTRDLPIQGSNSSSRNSNNLVQLSCLIILCKSYTLTD